MKNNLPPIVFFGTSEFSILILEKLFDAGFVPALIVTQPDMPKGRGLILTPPPAKEWAAAKNIPVFQPTKLDSGAVEALSPYKNGIFVVASYGLIIPDAVLAIPHHKTLNIHPSLLPKYRGATPLQSALLADDANTGVTIIEVDSQMDHGPIVAQEKASITPWPINTIELEKILGEKGGELLVRILPDWIEGSVETTIQDDASATFTRLIKKEDGLLDLTADPYTNYLKYLAYISWPGTHFFIQKDDANIRIKIKSAHFENGAFIIDTVVPEGRKEISWDLFKKDLSTG